MYARFTIKRMFISMAFISMTTVCVYYYRIDHQSKMQWNTEITATTESGPNPEQLSQFVKVMNELQAVLNEDKFGPLKPDDHVFVMMVHNRDFYLKIVIESMKSVRGINETLVIFSHSFVNNEINEMIRSIDFANVIQIFYPNSTQLYPNTYPGDDPNDCPRDMKKEEALRIRCNNAEHPDQYHHYREAKYAQIKLHSFWMFNFVFDRLRVMKNHKGFVTFIEDDYFFVPDTVYVLNYLRNIANDVEPFDFISLGDRKLKVDYITESGLIETENDFCLNLFTMTRHKWSQIKKCAKSFCLRDEYHFDLSFSYVVHKCVQKPLISLLVAASRIHHIGDCGMHRWNNNCFGSYEKIRRTVNRSMHYLFPKHFTIANSSRAVRITKHTAYGGFADPRDHRLCLSFVND